MYYLLVMKSMQVHGILRRKYISSLRPKRIDATLIIVRLHLASTRWIKSILASNVGEVRLHGDY